MRIAVDIHGTDNRPGPDVAGAVLAAREYGDTLILVGNQDLAKQELSKHNTNGLKFNIVHANQEIDMDERPSSAIKNKPESSIHVGTTLVKDGQADAFVSMGNTGAILTIATLQTLRRIPGIKRPALTMIFPVYDKPMIFVDIGANTDSKPEWMCQFGLMGSIYAQTVLGHEQPRVAILSNGEEEGKGNQQIQDTDRMIRNMQLNYVGYVEPKDITQGHADVIVTDGFVGNIFIKTFESSTTYLTGVIREELKRDIISTSGAVLAKPAFERVRKRVDPFEFGGAPLLGVNGVVIIGHGRSNAVAVKNGIRQARKAVEVNAIDAIKQGIG